jgi:hypothetical protein
MNEHKFEDRIPVNLDISKVYQFYKTAKWALQRIADEIDKSVIESGQKLPERRNGNKLGRRKEDLT